MERKPRMPDGRIFDYGHGNDCHEIVLDRDPDAGRDRRRRLCRNPDNPNSRSPRNLPNRQIESSQESPRNLPNRQIESSQESPRNLPTRQIESSQETSNYSLDPRLARRYNESRRLEGFHRPVEDHHVSKDNLSQRHFSNLDNRRNPDPEKSFNQFTVPVPTQPLPRDLNIGFEVGLTSSETNHSSGQIQEDNSSMVSQKNEEQRAEVKPVQPPPLPAPPISNIVATATFPNEEPFVTSESSNDNYAKICNLLAKAKSTGGPCKDNVAELLKEGFLKWKKLNPTIVTTSSPEDEDRVEAPRPPTISKCNTEVIEDNNNPNKVSGQSPLSTISEMKNNEESLLTRKTQALESVDDFSEFIVQTTKINNNEEHADPSIFENELVDPTTKTTPCDMNNIFDTPLSPDSVPGLQIVPFLYKSVCNKEPSLNCSSEILTCNKIFHVSLDKPSQTTELLVLDADGLSSEIEVQSSDINISHRLETIEEPVNKSLSKVMVGNSSAKDINPVIKSSTNIMVSHSSAEDISEDELEDLETLNSDRYNSADVQRNSAQPMELSPISSDGMPLSEEEVNHSQNYETSLNRSKKLTETSSRSRNSSERISLKKVKQVSKQGPKRKTTEVVVVTSKRRKVNPPKNLSSKEVTRDVSTFIEKRKKANLAQKIQKESNNIQRQKSPSGHLKHLTTLYVDPNISSSVCISTCLQSAIVGEAPESSPAKATSQSTASDHDHTKESKLSIPENETIESTISHSGSSVVAELSDNVSISTSMDKADSSYLSLNESPESELVNATAGSPLVDESFKSTHGCETGESNSTDQAHEKSSNENIENEKSIEQIEVCNKNVINDCTTTLIAEMLAVLADDPPGDLIDIIGDENQLVIDTSSISGNSWNVQQSEESEMQAEESSSKNSEEEMVLYENNSVSLILSGSGLNTATLGERSDLVAVDIDSFLSPSEFLNSEKEKTPSPEGPHLFITDDFPVLSIPERSERIIDNVPPVSTVSPDLVEASSKSPTNTDGDNQQKSKQIDSEEEEHEKTEESRISGEETNKQLKNTTEDDEPLVRIRNDLFSEDVDEKTEEILNKINESGKTVQTSICSHLMKFTYAFQSGTASAKKQIFRELKNILSQSLDVMDHLDIELITAEAMNSDLACSSEFDEFKHITVEEMADYFHRLYQLSMMIMNKAFSDHKSNLFMLHFRISRILKYYAVTKTPSQTESNFLNITKALESKMTNLAGSRYQIIRVWDYIKSFKFPIDEQFVLREHAIVGVKNFGILIEAIMRKRRVIPPTPTPNSSQPTHVGESASPNDEIEIIGESPGPNQINMGGQFLPNSLANKSMNYPVNVTSAPNSQTGFDSGFRTSTVTGRSQMIPLQHKDSEASPSNPRSHGFIDIYNLNRTVNTVAHSYPTPPPSYQQIENWTQSHQSNPCAQLNCSMCVAAPQNCQQFSSRMPGPAVQVNPPTIGQPPYMNLLRNNAANQSQQMAMPTVRSQLLQSVIANSTNQDRPRQQKSNKQTRKRGTKDPQAQVHQSQTQQYTIAQGHVQNATSSQTFPSIQYSNVVRNNQVNAQNSISSIQQYPGNVLFTDISPAVSPNTPMADEEPLRYVGPSNLFFSNAEPHRNERIEFSSVNSLNPNHVNSSERVLEQQQQFQMQRSYSQQQQLLQCNQGSFPQQHLGPGRYQYQQQNPGSTNNRNSHPRASSQHQVLSMPSIGQLLSGHFQQGQAIAFQPPSTQVSVHSQVSQISYQHQQTQELLSGEVRTTIDHTTRDK